VEAWEPPPALWRLEALAPVRVLRERALELRARVQAAP
jgi:hypothetical protein